MLKATDIYLSRRGAAILSDVQLLLLSGQVMVILGPNGSGKTSLLNVLTGELTSDRGDVFFQERPMAQWPAGGLAQRLAILPQHSTLNFPFTVEEVVMLGRSAHSSGHQRDREIVAAALQMVDSSYLSKRFYTQLSGGEKQRVQLARVLAQIWDEPEDSDTKNGRCLILDEPTSSFDLSHRQLMVDVIRHFSGQGVGILMVSHDLNLATQLADQIMLLSCGEVAAQGDVEQVMTPEILQRVFRAKIDVIANPSNGQKLIVY
ncbi:heme ABC transporter ATP-binding protein [bacterium SCSIO 12696]|nr:heme ABC transporter ATP-binding protein [bacterium SCSIO 12696]